MLLRKLEGGSLVLVLGLSLFLRLRTIDAFLTPDERSWATRSRQFRQALLSGEWSGTYSTSHPGVLTMWVGTAAIAQQPAGEASADTVSLIFRSRRVVALLSGLSLIPIWLLTRRLWGSAASLMGISLVALDPFLLAHSRLFHLDALTSLSMTISVLALTLYASREGGTWALLLSGGTAGLAVLNKSSALFLVPFAGLGLCYVAWRNQALSCRTLGSLARDFALWGSAMVGVWWLTWPVLWVDPLGTFKKVLHGALFYATTPHESGNYFWGQPRLDPGPAFYPLALLFRLSPLVLLGFGGWLWTRGRGSGQVARGLLPSFCVGFALFMTLGSKKLDRYLLPIFPSLDLLAGLGLALGSRVLAQRVVSPERRRGWLTLGSMAVWVLLQLALVLPQAPYYLSYYNPILGGGREASRALPVGWGEGLDQVAAWLNDQPESEHLTIATASYHAMLVGHYFGGRTDEFSWMDSAIDYFVFYISRLQQDPDGPINTAGDVPPVATITAKGIEYARIYSASRYLRPLAQYLDEQAHGEDLIVLGDYAPFLSAQLSSPAVWLPPDLTVAEAGARLEEAARGHTRVWYLHGRESGEEQFNSALYLLSTRGHKLGDNETMPPGRVTAYALPAQADLGVTAVEHPVTVRFSDLMEISGYGQISSSVDQTQAIDVALGWRALRSADDNYSIGLRLIDGDGQVWGASDEWLLNAEREPTSAWLPMESQRTYHALPVLFGAPPGRYTIQLAVYNRTAENGTLDLDAYSGDLPVQGPFVHLGSVQVEPSAVLPEMPMWDVPCPAHHTLVGAVDLLGSGCLPEQVAVGSALPLALFWHAREGNLPDYDMWVTLEPTEGGPTQTYRLPPVSAAYPSSAWREGEYLRRQANLALPASLPVGDYRVLLSMGPVGGEVPALPSPVALGTVSVEGRSHVFEAPAVSDPQPMLLGDGIRFLGYDLERSEATPGDSLPLTLYWQAAGPTPVSYKVFTHLLDSTSRVWGQQDSPPQHGQAPTTSWLEGEIITDQYQIPVDEDAPPGIYHIEVGLYDPEDGQRAEVRSLEGQRAADDRILLSQVVTVTW